MNEQNGYLKVKRLEDGSICALKKMEIPQECKVEALNKIRSMASVFCDHLIHYKESFYDESSGQLCIAMELVEFPDLTKVLEEATR